MGSKGVTLDSSGLTDLVTAVHHLCDTIGHGDLTPFADGEVVEFMQQLETCKRQLAALDPKLILEASERCLPETSGAGKLIPFLRQTLGLSAADASVRVKLARECGEFRGLNGQLNPAALPVLAEAAAAGDISRDHARNIVKIMTHLPGDLPAEERARTEELLVEKSCEGLLPDDLPKIGREIMARVDPDGTVFNTADRQRKRGITVGRPGIDGMTWIEGYLTPELRALLDPFLAKYARPGMCNPDDNESPSTASNAVIDSTLLDAAARRDRRDAAQRTHDAFIAMLQPGVDMSKLGKHRGMAVQTVFVMNLADVERGTGMATTASGVQVPIDSALKMATGTRPVLAVLDEHGVPVYLARGKRLASGGQRLGLIARDRGCTHPGCDMPASMCAAHHVIDWAKGGPTDLNNLALVCDHHHAMVNDSETGWKTVMLGKDSPHAGRVGWIAPKSIDPTQTPRVNENHHVGERVASDLEARSREQVSRAA
ncbi:DUF222 domain-containing protein [Nocardia sp. ET3-3]|uniref:DUF222 domain-containing protein n=1 Tax=Nocardia terrae TaxID=2675851 RepID=A0A7K1V651_9NOCA|nr:HNH endonuclease signature motif containing protein [Nocardia terrae]MVU82115.1 DUF222 domain-containing protein [Nocardia terrae]